ncbi:TetR/AcrR family transcriptional regulator [Paractinoplanes lichenicola]|uniref:TetR/AcrR family transcriptional regulator n=1 Tax=Paractinoplanes lichenicola TaxID=2802976 RepID=A0ABS1VVQ4_9ACTN|nr:TetR/AcrR family transcriptional regulator [Actinoplanes lichenicola]MBL7258562.1 TetR/AcrR family transcriptional regulator [Actinoplanes lichenicola]
MTLTRKGQATRERILEAAAELIAQRGVAGTSTEDVRKAAGIGGSQLYHYFDSKQALIRAVITRQAEAPLVPGQPIMGALDSFDALRAWADAAVEHQERNSGRGDCSLTALAGELGPTDDQAREDLCQAFLRWQSVLHDGLGTMRERGDLRPEANLDELSMALLTALQGGNLLSQTLRTAAPLRASMNAALAYVRSFT